MGESEPKKYKAFPHTGEFTPYQRKPRHSLTSTAEVNAFIEDDDPTANKQLAELMASKLNDFPLGAYPPASGMEQDTLQFPHDISVTREIPWD